MEEQKADLNAQISDLKELIEKNIQLSQEVLESNKKIEGFVFWQRVFSVLKILIIFIPLILGVIYLPPLLKDVFKTYQELLGIGSAVNTNVQGGLDNLPDSVKQLLK